MALTLDGTNGISASGGVNVLQDDSVVTGNLVDGAVTVPKIGATGTPGSGNFLRGDGEWATAGSPPGTLELLQEDIFTTSGTWTKASGFDPDDTVMLFVIGGGSSGAAFRRSTESAVAGGGSHGAITIMVAKYGSINSSYYCQVGAGGAAVTATSGNPAVVGNVGNPTYLYQGTSTSGFEVTEVSGGTGGSIGNPSLATATAGNGFVIVKNLLPNTRALREGGSEQEFGLYRTGGINGGTSYNTSTAPRLSFLGTGGVGTFSGTFFNPPIPGIIKSLGGAGNSNGNGVAGSAPGGGGGGGVRTNADVTSGAGGNGGLIVRYYRGRVSPFQVIFTGG